MGLAGWKAPSLHGKLLLLLLVVAALAAGLSAWLTRWLTDAVLGGSLAFAALLFPSVWAATRGVRRMRLLLRGLSSTVASYRDGDFSRSFIVDRTDELGELAAVHNELAEALRLQRAHLTQRELLLDTVMQNSPVALVLVDVHERIAYANLAARHVFGDGRSLIGLKLSETLANAAPALRTATFEATDDSLFTLELGGLEETFHLSQRSFLLQGKPYRLYLLKRLTRELSRQEVQIWKKLIRVLSHELNNSLGPLSSLAHTGAEIARRGDHANLPAVFAAIAERAEHLHRFLSSYATFAKLPAPRADWVEWPNLIADLRQQLPFSMELPLPATRGWFDRAQIEQVLINLLRNAHETGCSAQDVEVRVTVIEGVQRIEVRDRGPGMSQTVLAQALLPFYSTKRSGTGLGLALAREIAEAHGGRIHLANREGGGFTVTLDLPASPG